MQANTAETTGKIEAMSSKSVFTVYPKREPLVYIEYPRPESTAGAEGGDDASRIGEKPETKQGTSGL